MSQLDRRESMKLLFSGLLQTAGTVILASTVLPARAGQVEPQPTSEEPDTGKVAKQADLARRADRVAEEQGPCSDGEGEELCSFGNAAFRNTTGGGGAFKNGGFANGGGGGAFKNGGFANGSGGGGGGAFKNGGFANGGGGGGAAFRNAAGFRNY
jgi:hypothetical protein